MTKVKILIGADPELFLKDKKTGQLVSAHTFLPGTKLEPHKVELGAIQVDGTAAEFNIDPAVTATAFCTNIKHVMNQLKGYSKDYEFVLDPTATFEPTYFNSLPENVRELGCNPDFNAWSGEVNPAPEGSKTTMRTASGHIHVGWCKNINPMDKIHFEDCQTVVKELDYYLGLYSLLWDPDSTRRQLYGKAGAFRSKPYGCEYRTLSNVWLRSPVLQTWIWNTTTLAVKRLLDGAGGPLHKQFGNFAQRCIDGNVTDWMTSTKEGSKVHKAVQNNLPPVDECLNWMKLKAPPGPKKKIIANYVFPVTLE